MATTVLGIFFGGIITAVPVVTGVAEGVSHQRKANEDAKDDERMRKFWIDVRIPDDVGDEKVKKELQGGRVVLKDGKVWIAPRPSRKTTTKTGQHPGKDFPHHPFTGFYLPYPDDNRSPAQRGLVSTIATDPPMLNWLYVDKDTLEVRHGNRTASIQHVVGAWDWGEPYSSKMSDKNEPEIRNVLLEGFEGFVAVEEAGKRQDGLKWALYFDRQDDGLKGGRLVGGRKRVEIELIRRLLPEELTKAQDEEAERKMQVKQSGDLKTTLNLRDEDGKLRRA